MQLAVYLVNDETSQALLEANQMAEFNKRFAFLIHDMKNTIGQLDLLARNAERFSENPDVPQGHEHHPAQFGGKAERPAGADPRRQGQRRQHGQRRRQECRCRVDW